MIHFPIAAVGDVAAAIFIIFAIGSAVVNFFKEKNAQAAVEERQRQRDDNRQESKSEIDVFLNEIGATQPSTDINERRREQIQQKQERQREELRRRQQQRRQELQEQQQERQARKQTQRKRLSEQEPQQSRKNPKVVISSDDAFIDEDRNFDRVGDRHMANSVEQRHVESAVKDRHVHSAVEDRHHREVSHTSAKNIKKNDSAIGKLFADPTSIRNAVIISEILSPPKSRR
jgi:hypothetical protein